MLSERSQTRKATCCVIPFMGNVQNRQIHRDRKQSSGCQVLGEGAVGVAASGDWATFEGDRITLQ